MRQVNRVARKARVAIRRQPRRSWWMRSARVALLLLALGLTGWAAEASWRSQARQQLQADATARLLASTARAGFVVTRVYSEGRVLTDERALLDVIERYYGQPILNVGLDTIRAQVEKLPWVRSASVSRHLPDTLWVRIEEHRPVARWLDGNRQVLVTDGGEVVRGAKAARFRTLPLLFGAGAPERASEILRLIAVEPILASHVTGARLVGERRWDVYLDGRIEVRLPELDADAAWHRLASEQRTSAVLGRAITAIDLRHPDWLTLQLADGVAKPGSEPGA